MSKNQQKHCYTTDVFFKFFVLFLAIHGSAGIGNDFPALLLSAAYLLNKSADSLTQKSFHKFTIF